MSVRKFKVTPEEFGKLYRRHGCPFGWLGPASFIGRNNESTARKFCAGGCCTFCNQLFCATYLEIVINKGR